jgi:hypothetical protein
MRSGKLKHTLNALYQILNVLLSALWTIVFVLPVYIFCARHVDIGWIIAFAVTAMLSTLLPRSAIQRLALSSEAKAYRRLRVPLVIEITQDARWIRRISGNSPARARRSKQGLSKILHDTWVRERFHLALLVFYFLCSIMAVCQIRPLWFLSLILANVSYNLYPIWLQQYLRLRVSRCLARSTRAG